MPVSFSEDPTLPEPATAPVYENRRAAQPPSNKPGHAHGNLVEVAPRARAHVYVVAWLLGALLVMLIIIDVFAAKFIGGVMGMKKLADSGAFDPPPVAVTTSVVHATKWLPSMHAVGSLEAVQGVTVSADLPGIVKELNFESGKAVKKGDILVRLVTDQEQAQLEANQAQRDLAVYQLKRQRDLREKNTNSQSEFDNAEANQRQMEAMVSNARAAVDRKTIRAPFDGLLGIRKASLGQYLNSGDPVVTLQSMDPIYVNFSLPQQNLKDFNVGSAVEVHTDATGDATFKGKVTAVNSLVDESTRNVQAQATLANPDGKLRPGMFATVDVQLPTENNILPVPGSSIYYAPYGNSVFVITKDLQVDDVKKPGQKKTLPLAVVQRFVKTGETKGDLVAVLSGLKEGEEVVTSGVFKLQNKGAVQINNSVKPGAEENPNPEES